MYFEILYLQGLIARHESLLNDCLHFGDEAEADRQSEIIRKLNSRLNRELNKFYCRGVS